MAGNKRDFGCIADGYIKRFCKKHEVVLTRRLGEDLVEFKSIGFIYLRDIVWSIDNYIPADIFQDYLKQSIRQDYYSFVKKQQLDNTHQRPKAESQRGTH